MSMPVTTTFTIEGYRIVKYLGVVRGLVVRAPTITQGLLGDDLSDVERRDSKRLARGLQCDMRRVVGADEELRPGGGELLRILCEKGAKLLVVAAFPCVHHERHGAAGHGDFRMHVRTEPLHTLDTGFMEAKRRTLEAVSEDAEVLHSTVTLFARLRGWSTSVPFKTAV